MFANSERRKRWTWAYIASRRIARLNYINLYLKKKIKQVSGLGAHMPSASQLYLIAVSLRV